MADRVWQQEHFDRLAELTAADFEELVGHEVPLADAAGQTLTVTAVDRRGEEERPFTVAFSARPEVQLEQAMHAVELPGHGIVPLFIVPDLPTEDAARYSATFA